MTGLPLVFFVLCEVVVAMSDSNSTQNFMTISYNLTGNGTDIEVEQFYNETRNNTDINQSFTELSLSSTTTENPLTMPGKDSTLCPCNISEVCDDNCCCDTDCAVKIVEQCGTNSASVLDERYCANSKPKYDLFCIAYDNLQKRHYFQSQHKILDLHNLKNVKANNPYSWLDDESSTETEQLDHFHIYHTESMKMGQHLFVSFAQTSEPVKWSFPRSTFDNFCDTKETVRYMVDNTISCSHPIGDVGYRCAENGLFDLNLYTNFAVLTTMKENTNHSYCEFFPNMNVSCVSITLPTTYRYQNLLNDSFVTTESVHNMTIPRITFDGKVCHNAVLSVDYRIIHSGSKGIDSVYVNFELGSVHANQLLSQHFRVDFKYAKETVNSKEHIGYKVGEAIVIRRNSTLNDSKSNLLLTKFRTIDPNFAGFCQPLNMSKTTIKFGVNLNVGCLLLAPTMLNTDKETRCQNLQTDVWRYLFDLENTHSIGSWSKSDLSNDNDWVYINREGFSFSSTLVDDRLCLVVSTIRIVVFYAMTGQVVKPKAKVLAVVVSASSRPIIMCSNDCSDFVKINLKTTVAFKDLSTKPTYSFGHPPKIRASLPGDFFYPFLSASQRSWGSLVAYVYFWTFFPLLYFQVL